MSILRLNWGVLFSSDFDDHHQEEIDIIFGGEASAEKESVADIAPVRDELINPIWIEDKRLGTGKIEFLEEKETRFFNVSQLELWNRLGWGNIFAWNWK